MKQSLKKLNFLNKTKTETEKMFNSNEVLNQLTNSSNGSNRLKAMIGAKQFLQSTEERWIRFKFMGGTYLRITLNAMDTYDLEFFKIRKHEKVQIKEFKGIYCDMLKYTFEGHTKLYLSL
jgi:hypothetical protein